jgi:hypothetical protein
MRRAVAANPYVMDDLPDLVEARAFVLLGYKLTRAEAEKIAEELRAKGDTSEEAIRAYFKSK